MKFGKKSKENDEMTEQFHRSIRPVDLPWVFISFREPNANQNWVRIKQQIPEARRSHGVVGLDQAHQAAARLVEESDYFFTLDGDSTVADEWLHRPLSINLQPNSAWCWRSRNTVNGLVYGNGGVKLWHRRAIAHMQSHQTGVDFCWQPNYYSLMEIAGETNPGTTERQAFVAGCREGVKLTLKQGLAQTPLQLQMSWNTHNRSAWLTWCVRGAHHPIHRWAPFGARFAAVNWLKDKWPLAAINDWDFLNSEFDSVCRSLQAASSTVWFDLTQQTRLQTAVWQTQFEALGWELERMLDVSLPNCYSDQLWRWVDSCYHHRLGNLPNV